MSFPHKLTRLFFILLMIGVPLIFLPNTSELFEFNKMILTYLLTLLIFVAWIARMIIEKKLIFRRSLLDFPLFAFLLIQFVSLLLSIDPRTSLMGYYSRFNGGLLSLLCYSILYWAAVSNLDRDSTLDLIKWTLISTFFVAAWGFLEHFGADASWWVQDVQNRVFSTLGQPNWLAAYLVALIFIPLSQSLSAPKTKAQVLHASFAFFLFVVLIFTKSRSGLLAFAISSGVFWGYKLFSTPHKFPPTAKAQTEGENLGGNSKGVIKPFIIFCLLTISATLLISNPLRDLIITNVPKTTSSAPSGGTSLETGGTESGTIRKIVWTGAIRIWRASSKNFWLGSGPETFAMAYYQYRPLEHNATSEWELLYNKAHNEFLNYLSTTGLLGFVSYLTLLGFMLYAFILGLKTKFTSPKLPANPKAKAVLQDKILENKFLTLQLALLAGWISISITNFWGFSVVIIQILMFVLPAFALTLSLEPEKYLPTPGKTWQFFSQLVLYSLTAVLLYSLTTYWLADVSYAAGQHDFRAFNQTQDPQYVLNSYQELTHAYELNSVDSPIASDLSVSAAFMSLLLHGTDATASAQMAQIADMSSQRAIAASPYHPNYYKSRSRALVVLGSTDSKYYQLSDESLEKAQAISPTDPRIPYIRAINAKYDHHPELAKKYLEQALKLKPDFGDALNQMKLLNGTATPSAQTE